MGFLIKRSHNSRHVTKDKCGNNSSNDNHDRSGYGLESAYREYVIASQCEDRIVEYYDILAHHKLTIERHETA